jgi:PAS domain-containing protein
MSNFVASFADNVTQSLFFLDRARRMHPTLRERLVIYCKDKDRERFSQNEQGGESVMDYVEFQNSYNAALEFNKRALKAIRAFWRSLLEPEITLDSLSKLSSRIDRYEVKTDQSFKLLLERYPKSVKLMRSYGMFLEQVKKDPWSAAKYFNEADKIESAAAEARRRGLLERGEGGFSATSQVDDKVDAVIVANEGGIIQFVNPIFAKAFGYQKEELVGRNLNVLMPPPFSTQHDSYLQVPPQPTRTNRPRTTPARARRKSSVACARLMRATRTATASPFSSPPTASSLRRAPNSSASPAPFRKKCLRA